MIDDLLVEIEEFLNDPGCVVPESALSLVVRAKVAILRLSERVSIERERGNRLQEDVESQVLTHSPSPGPTPNPTGGGLWR